MNHDPLCGYDWVDASDCQCCQEYAAVRADERERFERVIYENCYHTKYEGCRPCIHDEIVSLILGED